MLARAPVLELHGRLSGPENMARDQALLERAHDGTPGARIYSWDGPWVSLGRFQNPLTALLSGAPTRWVMRPTGGKAVLHGHDITVGLAAPIEILGVKDGSRRLRAAYRAVIEPLIVAMRACGIDAAFAEDLPRDSWGKASEDCFVRSEANDIVDRHTGRKVCGCALRFTRMAMLLQASIPAGEPLIDPALVFENPASHACPNWNADLFPAALEDSLADLLG